MLREALTPPLPFQAPLTHEVRLARAFTASALVRASLADLLAHAPVFINRLRRFWRYGWCFG